MKKSRFKSLEDISSTSTCFGLIAVKVGELLKLSKLFSKLRDPPKQLYKLGGFFQIINLLKKTSDLQYTNKIYIQIPLIQYPWDILQTVVNATFSFNQIP